MGRPSEREIVIHQINAMTRSADPAELERLCQYVDDGILTLRVAEIMPSSRASAAHKRFEAGGVRCRLVLDFSPSGSWPAAMSHLISSTPDAPSDPVLPAGMLAGFRGL